MKENKKFYDCNKLLIFCGGKATRMQGVNEGLPKPLIKVHDKSFLTRLIIDVHKFFDKIIISYSGTRAIFEEILNQEIQNNEVLKKIEYFEDTRQTGTANALQDYFFQEREQIICLNGDTLFDHPCNLFPSDITKNVNGVVVSTCFQKIGSSGHVTTLENGQLSYQKDRDGKNHNNGWVLNGALYFSTEAILNFLELDIKVNDSFETFLFPKTKENRFNTSIYKAKLKFFDLGTPDDFINADRIYSELVLNR